MSPTSYQTALPRDNLIMVEEEGFEPPRGLTRLSVFKTDPFSQTWVFLHIVLFPLMNLLVDLAGLEPATGRL